MTPAEQQAAIIAQLVANGITAVPYPADQIATDQHGLVPTVVVAVHAPRDTYRTSGNRANGVASATLYCVSGHRLDTLTLAAFVRAALDGWRIHDSAGRCREDGYTGLEPFTNPQADPVRVELPLSYRFPL